MTECKQLASQASGGTAKETAIGAGAAAGGFGGAAKQGFSAEDKFKGAYSNCMSGRGHNVLRS